MSSLHEKLEEGDDDHELSKKINKEAKDDDHQEAKNDILQSQKEINEEQAVKKQKGSEMSLSSLHEKLEEGDDDNSDDDHELSKKINEEMKDDDHQEEKDDILQKEINEEQEVLKKKKSDDDGDDRSASVHEKLKELDDGTFDKMKKEIELMTAGDKQETERLLTKKIIEGFVLAHQNAHKDRQEIKLKVSKKVQRNFNHHFRSAKASELDLVIEKALTDSELSDDDLTDQSGLSIPKDSIKHHLSKQEIEKIDKEGGLEVTLWEILTTSNVLSYTLILKKLGTDYVLTGQYWNEVKRRNRKKFRRADGGNADIQLFSYRTGLRLNFALFVVKEEPKSGVASTD